MTVSQWPVVSLQIPGGKKIKTDYMPDVLHPNGPGMEQMLTTCVDPHLGLKLPDLGE